ncbi:MAG TPA: amino acid ABC transporter permease [Clostridium sp.]
MNFDIQFAIRAFPKILEAAPISVFITVVSIIMGLIIALFITLVRTNKVPILNQLTKIFISFVRGTPLIVNLYILYFVVPYLISELNNKMGWHINANNVNPYVIAIIAFSLSSAAFLSEIIRSALSSVDKSQSEAAYSVGLTKFQTLRRIVIPQALIVATPNLGNIFLSLMKGTSLAYAVSVVELLGKAKIEAAEGFNFMEAYVDVAIIYWIISFIFEKFFSIFESRLKSYKKEVTM